MLIKSKRLRSEEVDQVMKTGKSLRSAHLQVKFVSTGIPIRCAAVVPKSIARKAVARNTIRRALYRALAASKSNAIKGNAVFFVRLVPKEKLTAVFSEELIQLFLKLS